MVKSSKIYKAIKKAEDIAKESIIEFFKSHNLTEMEFFPNEDLFVDEDEFDYYTYEQDIQMSQVYALGHHRKWVELIQLTKMELKEEGDSVEFYCYGYQECTEYEGKEVELLPESYAEILEFLETVEPYLEYYKKIA